jgi:CheY-like chemotaxis protein
MTLPRVRVLAAEDNSVNQLVLKTLLHQIGVEPQVVDNGEEAVRAWTDAPWDVILMDMQMPVMDGLAAACAIREAERASGRPRTPIIALTANAMSHQIAQCLAAGMDGHVAKPIEASRLFAALEGALADAEDAPAAAAQA